MPWLVPVLVVLLLLSGFCGLVYQVLWLRLLALTFGVTVYAAAAVLASFMGGLALGSVIAGRLADRSSRPLRAFGIVEALIGVCAAASPWVLDGLQALIAAASPVLPESVVAGTLVRLVGAGAVLLIPTTLMGATMPLVIKASLTQAETLGAKVGVLYAANTTGAIVGTVAAGFFLIPQLGLSQSFLLAAAINCTIGVMALVVSRFVVASAPAVQTAGRPAADPPPVVDAGSDSGARAALLVAGISGFASLALEVVWFRLLAIFVGPTSYTFTLVLATVLAGIALGSAIAAPILRWRRVDAVAALAVVQLAGAALVLGSVWGILQPVELPVWFTSWLSRAGAEFATPALAMSVGMVLPSALFFGVSFPMALRVWAAPDADGASTGRRIGIFYGVNLGAGILGSLLAGFVLLPLLGSRTSVVLLAFLYVVGGLAALAACARRRPMLTGLAVAAVVALVVQSREVVDPLDVIQRRIYTGRPVIWQDEGVQTTVAVVGSQHNRVMYLDGRHQANDTPGMVFIHRRIGLLPVVLHPAPERALVVGLGGGATPGGISQAPGIHVDVVELSQGVIDAAAYFSHVNFDLLTNPRVTVRVDDGRHVLQRVPGTYDVVTADAIIPRHAGANSLNSVEYFTLVSRALKPGGLALHWNGGATQEEYRLILSAFAAVFPDVTLWGDGSLMVGSHTPLTVSQARIDARLSDPDWRHALGLMQVEKVADLERMFRFDDAAVRAFIAGVAPLSDDRPLLEYYESLPKTERNLEVLTRRRTSVIVP